MLTNKPVQNLDIFLDLYIYTHTEHWHKNKCCLIFKSLPSVNQEQEKKSKGNVSNVAEDVVEGTDKPPGVGTVKVIVADVQIPCYIQYLPKRIKLWASTSTIHVHVASYK